ncbi:MAG: nitroreductase family protein [Endomicrobia bacterium]|nr:nitroreductase family protein [Endomicrobiia bacterium]MCL2798846.1 nitroreductase family protein [Endomicrobiia bacterium]
MKNKLQNEIYDTIKKRHSTRQFSKQAPDLEMINMIAETGILAPYAGANGIPREEIRKIYIFPPNTENRKKLEEIIQKQLLKNAKKLSVLSIFLPKLKSFSQRIYGFSKNGIPGLSKGTYLILVAEKKGFPPVAKQAAAHALQSMWIYAVSLGLGFQMLSALSTLSSNKDVFNLLGLEHGKYELDGCLVGIPDTLHMNKEFDTSKSIKSL